MDVEGARAWVVAGGVDVDAPPPPTARLLPYIDAFVVGSQPRGRLFPGRAAERALARSQAGNYPVLLLDGVVGGVWHQRLRGRTVDVTVEPLAPLTRAQTATVDAEVGRLGRAIDARPRLTVGKVSVGPHA